MADDGATVKVDDRALRRALRNAAEAVTLEGAASPLAEALARALASTAPRRTGALSRSARPIRAAGVVAAARPTARYAGPVNSGVPSRGIRATRFVDEAGRVAEREVAVISERYLQREIGG